MRYQNKAVLAVLALNLNGKKEVLGLYLSAVELLTAKKQFAGA